MAKPDGETSPDSPRHNKSSNAPAPNSIPAVQEFDDFGLPIRTKRTSAASNQSASSSKVEETVSPKDTQAAGKQELSTNQSDSDAAPTPAKKESDSDDDAEDFKDANSSPPPELENQDLSGNEVKEVSNSATTKVEASHEEHGVSKEEEAEAANDHEKSTEAESRKDKTEDSTAGSKPNISNGAHSAVAGEFSPKDNGLHDVADVPIPQNSKDQYGEQRPRARSTTINEISEWSHQQLTTDKHEDQEDEGDWQEMPAYAPYDIYDDDNRLVAREAVDSDDEIFQYGNRGGAGNGYTRVQLDEDAQSATSLDDDTQYLFGMNGKGTSGIDEEDPRDAVAQLQATKDLLTEGQRIAYVGVARLVLSQMAKEAESVPFTRSTKKEVGFAAESMKMWSQKMIVRLYAHMEINTAEQVMIEQLAEHGVEPEDLTPTLMQNARVRNPMADSDSNFSRTPMMSPSLSSRDDSSPGFSSPFRDPGHDSASPAPPSYHEHEGEDLPDVRTPSQLPTTQKIDIDIRWTVLCDLFLTLIADSIYDARSRTLLERVGNHLSITWLDICRFEKRVTDALEMQQQSETENWNEAEHMENRRKMALKKRYMVMGLATVGGGLVIGLSAGLLAPVIGAGLAAGFSTLGVAGTSGFLAGAGGAAIITTTSATAGGIIGVRAANRRTGSVKTFEYRPLHNNKRVNLIVTVSGWMTGKVDDVRLPFSTVDPIMGDIYSILWEPDMLQSMGDTINILATEALTQGLQQLLGSTILISLMAALQLPVVLTKLSYLIDNPWAVSLDRANATGLILADSLIDRNLGTRPITFVGYSLGSRVIFSCLRELARKGAYGLVQNVYLFGSPIVAKKDEYIKARAAVSGRFVNGYAKNDWILGYLFRLTNGGLSTIAGLGPVDVPGIENVDVTELVPGHMAYRGCMPKLLREVGWLVESDEFSEIEDPDPENHERRQRELINEIEEARKGLEKQEAKGKFGFFSRKKKSAIARKEWETYQESKPSEEGEAQPKDSTSNDGVLFDVDAIRAELAKELAKEKEHGFDTELEIKELESTLPPMKLDLANSPNPHSNLRGTKSWSSVPSRNDHSPSFHGSSGYQQHYPDEDNMQMTFDTSYTTPGSHNKPLPTPPGGDHQRPEYKSANTMPALGIHNAWADDDDDEDYGKEKEIEMTFA